MQSEDGSNFFISKENEYVLGYIDENSENKSIIFYNKIITFIFPLNL